MGSAKLSTPHTDMQNPENNPGFLERACDRPSRAQGGWLSLLSQIAAIFRWQKSKIHDGDMIIWGWHEINGGEGKEEVGVECQGLWVGLGTGSQTIRRVAPGGEKERNRESSRGWYRKENGIKRRKVEREEQGYGAGRGKEWKIWWGESSRRDVRNRRQTGLEIEGNQERRKKTWQADGKVIQRQP